MRSRERFARAQAYIRDGLRRKTLKPVIDRVLAVEDMVEAHRYLGTGTRVGKIVTTV